MMKLLLLICFLSISAHASKIDQVMNELRKSCPEKNVAKPDLIGLVRDAFLTCESGTTIQVSSNCEIPCLKENMGNVVGSSEIEWD